MDYCLILVKCFNFWLCVIEILVEFGEVNVLCVLVDNDIVEIFEGILEICLMVVWNNFKLCEVLVCCYDILIDYVI